MPHVFTLAMHPSPLGEMMLVADADGRLRSLDFSDHRQRLEQLLDRHYGRGGWTLVEGPLPAISAALDRYFAGDLAALDGIPVACNGTEFQRAAWDELRRIPAGETISYGEQARRMGRPKANRAVGLANGCNPIGVVVPCHRVIGSTGALTGYGGGVERKRWLLAHERAHAGGALL